MSLVLAHPQTRVDIVPPFVLKERDEMDDSLSMYHDYRGIRFYSNGTAPPYILGVETVNDNDEVVDTVDVNAGDVPYSTSSAASEKQLKMNFLLVVVLLAVVLLLLRYLSKKKKAQP